MPLTVTDTRRREGKMGDEKRERDVIVGGIGWVAVGAWQVRGVPDSPRGRHLRHRHRLENHPLQAHGLRTLFFPLLPPLTSSFQFELFMK